MRQTLDERRPGVEEGKASATSHRRRVASLNRLLPQRYTGP
jgi:hypothetical protein